MFLTLITLFSFQINPVFPNRTALLHLHNMALSRAFFWSYILQSRFIRPAINDTYDPGMMYYFLSTVADVSANPTVNASSIYFAPNSSYSSSYRGFFNKTFPRFAPRTFRVDDFNDPIHLQKISTLNTFSVQDLGAIPSNSFSKDYTTDYYKINEWYRKWLPDDVEHREYCFILLIFDASFNTYSIQVMTQRLHMTSKSDMRTIQMKHSPFMDRRVLMKFLDQFSSRGPTSTVDDPTNGWLQLSCQLLIFMWEWKYCLHCDFTHEILL